MIDCDGFFTISSVTRLPSNRSLLKSFGITTSAASSPRRSSRSPRSRLVVCRISRRFAASGFWVEPATIRPIGPVS